MDASLLYKTQTRKLFHAHIKLKLSAFVDDSIFDEFYAAMEEVNAGYNSYVDGSFLDQINRQAGFFVDTNPITVNLLTQVKNLSDDLAGEYDITIMPLLRLWGFYDKYDWTIPDPVSIAEAKQKVNYQSIQINGLKIKIETGQEITTGSFLKAYAVDAAVGRIKQAGISDAIVNAGGSTIFAINNEVHPTWQVAVNDPETKKPLFLLRIANQCYSTSSNENTYLELDGKRYGHIISPKTGYPTENRQVGIVSRDAFTGDVLSTGLFNFDKDTFTEKINFLSAKYGIEGFMTDKNGETVFSENFEKYIC